VPTSITILLYLYGAFAVFLGGAIMINNFRNKYREFLRPFIGTILFRKPLLRASMDSVDLFRVANYGRTPVKYCDIINIELRIKSIIRRKSWFKKYDNYLLAIHASNAGAHLNDVLRQKRMREEQRWNSWWKDFERFKNTDSNRARPASQSSWRITLGVSQTERDVSVIKNSYRRLTMKHHPDRGGDGKKMPELNAAIDQARKELNFV
jgi:hypothetical protein